MSGSMNDSDRVFVRQFAKLIGGLIVLTVSLVTIAMMVHNHHPEAADPTAQAQVDARIAPVGAVYAGNTGRAAMQAAADAAAKAAASQVAYGGSTDGKTIFDNLCTSCHTAGVAGAPKFGDKAAWAPRIAQGMATLFKHATEGYHGPDGNFMPPKGGNPALSEAQVQAAVTFMVDHSK
jgi:cytochrome c5